MSKHNNGLRDARRRAERGIFARRNIKKKKKRWPVVLSIILILIILLVLAFLFFLRVSKNKVFAGNDVNIDSEAMDFFGDDAPVIYNSGSEIQYEGKTYDFNPDIVSLALLGVDKREFGLEDDAYGTAGQSDTIAIAAYNTKNGETHVLTIPRETMVDVNVYTTEGGYYDIQNQQICVAYAYGDGENSSCENTLTSIKRLLLGIPINYYVTMDLNGIPALNDAVGGVEVTCLETIGDFKEGETVTLKGMQAERYVRSRAHDIVDADTYRRARQRQYIQSFFSTALEKAKKNFSFVSKFYKQSMEYINTNLSFETVSYIASNAVSNNVEISDFRTVPGKYKQGDVYAEYYVNEKALFRMILDVYYTERTE